MNNSVFINSISLPEVNIREVRRYLRTDDTDEINSLIKKCMAVTDDAIEPRVCYRLFDIKLKGADVVTDSFCFSSSDLCVCLKNCDQMVMFCATIGCKFDRLIRKYSVIDNAMAVCLHALGTERIEALCDEFCKYISSALQGENYCITPRFSPGYGNLDISTQKIIFDNLDISEYLGVSLNEAFLMTPSKTVTAIFGIKHV